MEIAGSVESISLDGREFAATADSEVTRKIGGFKNELLPNGNGTARMSKEREPWMLGGVVIAVDDDRGDQPFLQALANRQEFFPVSITYVSGATWQATGQISSEITYSNQSAAASFDLSGMGELTKQ